MKKTRKNKKNIEKRDFKPLILNFLIQFGLSLVLTVVFGIIYGFENESKLEILTMYSTVISFFIIFLIFIIMYRKKLKNDWKNLTKKEVKKIIIFFVIFMVTNITMTVSFNHFGITSENQEIVNDYISNSLIISSITTVIFAPFIEEIVYRYSIRTIIKNKFLFIFISGLLFAIPHGVGITMIIYWVLGAILAILYEKTNKNIWTTIIVHFLSNFIGVILLII